MEDLVAADGIAFGTPENFGTMSGMMKDLFDRTFYPAQGKVFRKPYVVFVSAGNDGSGALNAVERIALGYQFRKVYDPVIAKGEFPRRRSKSAANSGGPRRRLRPRDLLTDGALGRSIRHSLRRRPGSRSRPGSSRLR